MKRIQLFEFEDFEWFPNVLRGSITNLIGVLLKMIGVETVLSNLCIDILKRTGIKSIIDLGSGSGGAMPDVLKILNDHPNFNDIQLILSDKFPNPAAIKQFENVASNISYHSKSVDATDLTTAPNGLRTMVNCFHHMKPDQAKKILQSAQESRQPFLIYEMAENKIPTLVWWMFLPIGLIILILMSLFMTPFVKPLNWKQVIFTYLIPIIPITYAWDGQASMPRMYTFDDFDELLKEMETKDYTWEKGRPIGKKGKPIGTYFLGMPKEN